MSRTLSSPETGKAVKLDYTSGLFIVLGFSLPLLEAIVHVGTDMYITVASLIFALMGVGALGLHGALVKGGNERAHDFGLGSSINLLVFLFGVIAVYITQIIVLRFLPLSTVFSRTVVFSSVADSTAFYVGASMNEEMFFRYFLQTWIQQMMDVAGKGQMLLLKLIFKAGTYLSVCTAFMLYHIAVYGNSEQGLVAVFFGSLVFCIALDITKRISVTQAIHGWVDVMVGVASAIGFR